MVNPLSRTLTFLFSDLEGSSRLWEKFPDAMRVAVARHDAMLREAIESQRGQIVKTTGDGVHAVFTTAQDAVAASVIAQRALQNEKWDERITLRVRMGMHTGTSEEREGDFYGSVVNRAARLMGVGSGGQVLLSKTTFELARDQTPREISFRDLGEHRLRDLSRPEHIYQLIAPGLALDFVPLKTLEAHPNNLPVQLTNFIGREKEIAHVKEILAHGRLVTLTGVGGSGKTRLALQVAADLLESFPDGIWLIELAALSDPTLVPQTIASVLHVREEQNRTLVQTLSDHLQIKQSLIVLDNCEHLVDACAKLADTLLHACPQLKILATSREPLGIGGEKTVRVPSLSLPDIKNLPAPETFGAYEAIHLFIDRASAIQSNFQVTTANASAIAQICYRLDGIPLAIELAAARVKVLKVEELAARLDDRYRLLAGGNRAAMPRQQTLRALMDWSHDLLLEKERVLLRRLAVFAGGWTLEAAEEICHGELIAEKEILDLLIGLVDKSLVNLDDQGVDTRYQMLETVRQYALYKLIESGETAGLRERHLDYFVAYAEKMEPKLKSKGAEQAAGMKALKVEHENLRAALDWSQNDTGGAAKGLRLSSALRLFWEKENTLTEGREWLKKFLELAKDSKEDSARGQALYAAGHLAHLQGHDAEAIDYYELDLKIENQDTAHLAQTHLDFGEALYRRAVYESAADHFKQVIELGETIHQPVLVARARMRLGMIHHDNGDFELALESHRRSLEVFQRADDKQNIATALANLARALYKQKDYARAIENNLQAIHLYESLGNRYSLAGTCNNLSDIYIDLNQYAEAIPLLNKAMQIAVALENPRWIATTHRNLAACYLGLGKLDRAMDDISRALVQIAKVQAADQEGVIYWYRAEIWATQGLTEKAREDFDKACNLLEPFKQKSNLAGLYRSYGKFLMRESSTRVRGSEYLAHAVAIFEALGSAKEVEKTKTFMHAITDPVS